MDDDRVTRVIFAAEARKRLWAGLKVAAEAVAVTLGPKGHTVLLQQPNKAPTVTKDGISVARAIRLPDPVERMGAQMVIEAAGQTNDVAGDGTTTSTVLTEALVREGLKLVEAGYDSLAICNGIRAAHELVDVALGHNAQPVANYAAVAQVGTISANGDKNIGELIAQAMEKVGRDGIITVEDAKGMATTLEVAEGMQLDRGYISPYFVTDNERMRAVYDDAFVLVTDRKLTAFTDIVPVLEQVQKLHRPLLVIADDFEGEAMTGLVVNRAKSQFPVVAIKSPGYGLHRQELLHDICVLTGATLVSASTGLTMAKVTEKALGKVKKLTVDAKTTTLVGSTTAKENVDKHLNDLRGRLADVTLSPEEMTKLKQRIARLASGVAVIKVGGSTEIEMGERKDRVEDALNATNAATAEGIVPGGGMALFRAADLVFSQVSEANSNEMTINPEELAGGNVLLKACKAPFNRIVSNAGKTPAVVVEGLKSQGTEFGYNAACDEYVDMVREGIIDPVKVVRTALKNAVSVATTFLSLDAVVYEEAVKKDEKHG